MLIRHLAHDADADRPPEPTPDQVRLNRRTAVRQLENAELYLVAVENLPLADPEAQRALKHLRDDLHALIWRLTRPSVLG